MSSKLTSDAVEKLALTQLLEFDQTDFTFFLGLLQTEGRY